MVLRHKLNEELLTAVGYIRFRGFANYGGSDIVGLSHTGAANYGRIILFVTLNILCARSLSPNLNGIG